jgi:uncharacterized protein YjbJ (UPF0337 family)
MEWARIAGNWEHFKGNALRHWRRLTAAQLDAIAGSRAQLATHIEQAYRLSCEEAERQLASWQQAQKERHFLR